MAEPAAPAASPSLRRLLSLVRPYLLPLLGATGITLLESAVTLATPRVAGVVVDTAILERSRADLDLIVLGLLGLFALRGALSFAQLYLLRSAGVRMLRDLRSRVFSHLLTLTPSFYDERRIGELLSRIGSDASRVQTTLTAKVPEGVRALVVFLGTLCILFWMNVSLTLLSLVVVPPIALLAMWYGKRLERLGRRIQDALADTSATAEEVFSGVRTVQSFGREDHERERYRGGLGVLLGLELRSARLVGAYVGALQFLGFAAFAAVLWYGGRLIVDEKLTPGQLTAFLLYAFSIATSISTLGSLYSSLRELRGASARTFEILETPAAISDPASPSPLPGRGRLRYDDLCFTYPGAARPALENVSLEVEPGEVVALVGPSGAGKSTLLSLLMRFYDVDRGRVLVDDVDVRDAALADLRAGIAVVPQDIFLFGGSVADNVRYGRPDASDDELVRAAVDAGADAFIRALPDGYDSIVGERGIKLSAGQRQRIAIARAFLREPRFLLLDEATSALDADSEAIVGEAIERLMHGRTTLVIAHRLATARRADRIAVVDAGRILDVGRHDELVERCELYRRFWTLQGPGVVAGEASL